MRNKVIPLLLAAIGCLLIVWGGLQVSSAPSAAEYTIVLNSAEENSDHLSALLSAGKTATESLSRPVSGSIISGGNTLTGSLNRSATVTVYAVSPGWFDIYHRTLTDGRILGEEELSGKDTVLVADSGLMFALFGEGNFREDEVTLNGQKFRLVGVVDHHAQAGQQDKYTVYIPIQAAGKAGISYQTGILSSKATTLSDALFFKNACSNAASADGTLYYLNKEKMRQLLPVRYLLVLLAIWLLAKILGIIKKLARTLSGRLKERSRHVYAGRMILPWVGTVLLLLLLAGLWILGCYGTFNLAVYPVYTFTEWVPEDPSSLSSILKVFSAVKDSSGKLITLSTPSVGMINYFGGWIGTGSVLCLFSLLFTIASKKKTKAS